MQDPYNIPAYLASNLFLADLNNERGIKDPQYAVNLASLEDLVLFRFEDDITVVPRDSAWFGYFDGKQLWQMEDTQLYQVGALLKRDGASNVPAGLLAAGSSVPTKHLHDAQAWTSLSCHSSAVHYAVGPELAAAAQQHYMQYTKGHACANELASVPVPVSVIQVTVQALHGTLRHSRPVP